jgi:hypothetical protein
MSFAEAVATLPAALRLWVLWLTVVMVAAPLILLLWRQTRQAGAVIAGANLAVAVAMHALHAAVGMVRLLGLPHVLIWASLLVWGVARLRRGPAPPVPRVALAVFLLSIAVSLVFDVVDVVRWLLGDRAPVTGAAAG